MSGNWDDNDNPYAPPETRLELTGGRHVTKSKIEIVTQPHWVFWSFEEAYTFLLDQPETDVRGAVLRFVRSDRGKGLSVTGQEIQFRRGSLLGTLFSPVERHFARVAWTGSATCRGTAVVWRAAGRRAW